MMGSVGKGSLLLAVFPPHLSCLRTGLGLGTHPCQDIKTPHGHKHAGLISLHGNIFPCFGFSVFSTVLLKHVQYMAPGQPCCNSFSCKERLLLLQHTRHACKPVALHRLSEGTARPGEPTPTPELILLCPFPISNPMLACVMLSLMTPTKMPWAKLSLNVYF